MACRERISGQVAIAPLTTRARASSGRDAPGALLNATSCATTASRGQNALVTGPRATIVRPVSRDTSAAA